MLCKRVILALALTCAVGRTSAADAATPLNVSVSDREVIVSGVTSKQSVVLFNAEQDVHDFGITFVTDSRTLADTAGGGEVHYTPTGGVALRSIWVAVDLKSGNFAAAHPDGFTTAQLTPSKSALVPAADRLRVPFVSAYVFVARPEVGAWMLFGYDGGQKDTDGQADGGIQIAVDSMAGVGSNVAKISNIGATDVLFAVNTVTLEFILTGLQ